MSANAVKPTTLAPGTSDNMIQRFGYTEMYEWVHVPNKRYGLFVQFDLVYTDRIVPYHDGTRPVLGVSSINSAVDSDDPDHWRYAYMCNEVGDVFLKKTQLAVGIKAYDQDAEVSYIHTMPYEVLNRIENEHYNPNRSYVKRSGRKEWTRVCLLGKCIVYDNGTCTPGNYASPYVGRKMDMVGTAVPYNGTGVGFYVLSRISDNTIMIVNSPGTNIYNKSTTNNDNDDGNNEQ